MNFSRMIMRGLFLFIVFGVLYGVVFFLYRFTYFDVFQLIYMAEKHKSYIIIMVFIVSLYLGIVVNYISSRRNRPKVLLPPVRIDDLTKNIYCDFLKFCIDKDCDGLNSICTDEMIDSLRLINTGEYRMPMYVDVKILHYDQENGVISVICTGFFSDNSICKNSLLLVRDQQDGSSYLLSQIGVVR